MDGKGLFSRFSLGANGLVLRDTTTVLFCVILAKLSDLAEVLTPIALDVLV